LRLSDATDREVVLSSTCFVDYITMMAPKLKLFRMRPSIRLGLKSDPVT
jgi:hypothetical protein